jgi:hypothetical protein
MEPEDIKLPTESTVDETTTDTVVEPRETSEPGAKTDPTLLLKSLKEEREKRRKLEEQIELLQTPKEAFSDEGKLLESKIKELDEKIALNDTIALFPALKDKSSEFTEFKKDYPGVAVDKLAKLFLAEKELLDTAPDRKGLEPASGGVRTPPKTGLTSEEVGDMRMNNHRKYMKLLHEGKIKLD